MLALMMRAVPAGLIPRSMSELPGSLGAALWGCKWGRRTSGLLWWVVGSAWCSGLPCGSPRAPVTYRAVSASTMSLNCVHLAESDVFTERV